jgi:hypothetical protein
MHRYSGFDETTEDISTVTTSKQTVTKDMKNINLHGGDSYPSLLAGIKGSQFRSRQFRSRSRIRQNAEEEGEVTRQ